MVYTRYNRANRYPAARRGGGGKGFGKSSYKKKSWAPRKQPYVAQTIVPCHAFATIDASGGVVSGCVKISDILNSQTFIKQSALTERFSIQGVHIKVVPSGGLTSMLTCVSKDDEIPVTDINVFLRQPSLMHHDLSKSNVTCSRSLTAMDMPQLSREKLACSQASTLLGNAMYTSSIKWLCPDAPAGSKLSVYVTWKVNFMGSQDLSSTQYSALVGN